MAYQTIRIGSANPHTLKKQQQKELLIYFITEWKETLISLINVSITLKLGSNNLISKSTGKKLVNSFNGFSSGSVGRQP